MTKDSKILNLGCGNRPLPGAINHDRQKFAPHVDIAWDLEVFPWPMNGAAGGPYDLIHARDVLEHVSPGNFYRVMDSLWGLLSDNGELRIQVPQVGSLNAIVDPTHWRGFHLNSFDYLDPDTRLGRACWTTKRRWTIIDKGVIPRTKVNLRFALVKRC